MQRKLPIQQFIRGTGRLDVQIDIADVNRSEPESRQCKSAVSGGKQRPGSGHCVSSAVNRPDRGNRPSIPTATSAGPGLAWSEHCPCPKTFLVPPTDHTARIRCA
ncbi:hypothetical protein M0534_11680 [Methylonatrum kenyense]|uniref:hypothetical protein n=1 Tax=Methylonatrum kenyense TaxID=455253 RepID=UPI0020C14BD8|nr:hypothetical protein [Methylonatrum kenyense]MCK8516980.1 hypothetical protein [Methylonatrum kenyense]